MPEWNNVVRIGAFDQSVIAKLKCNYPRYDSRDIKINVQLTSNTDTFEDSTSTPY
jgi:hypothetical protein